MTFDRRLGLLLAAWVDRARRRPGLVLAGTLLLCAASLAVTGRYLGIRGDTDSLFSPDLPFKQAERHYQEAFPLLYENIFVVIDAPTPERASEAASALAARLQDRPEHFHGAYLPGGGDFFEQHAFLYLETDQLENLADRLAEVQPYLAELSRDGTLRGLASMLGRGVRAVREGDIDPERLREIFDSFGAAIDAALAGRPHHVSWAEVLAAEQIEEGDRRRFLLVQPVLDVTDLQPARRAILEIRRLAENLGLTPERGVEVRITGDVALSYEEIGAVRSQAAAAGLASLVLVAVILGFGLRSLRMMGAVLATLIVGLLLTAGFTTVAVGHLNMISAAFAVLFIGLGVDFGIHVGIRYQELLRQGRDHAAALHETATRVGSSLALCALTTALAFFAFVPTAFVGVAELGLISGAGMFISLFCTLTVLPALLSLRPPKPRPEGADAFSWSGKGVAALPLRHPRTVRVAALVLGVGAVLVLPQARFDNNPLNVRDPSAESVLAFSDLLERAHTSPWSLDAVVDDLESAQALARRLRELPEVDRVVSVADFVPSEQQAKLDIIEDVAMFLAPLPDPDGGVHAPTPAEQRAALVNLGRSLDRLLGERPEAAGAVLPSARRLRAALAGYLAHIEGDPQADPSLAALEESLLASLPEQLRMLSRALEAGRVTLENLPDALRERMLSADGRVRVQIFPSADLKDHAALERFVDRVKEIQPRVAGSAQEILESGRAVKAALTQALVLALVAMTALLLLIWRRLDDTALVLVPLMLAAALTVATAVLLGIPFNFADVIVLPLILGIGVDSGIHLVHRARTTGGRETNLLGTSTARAVFYSAATTIGSFGTMGFASHRGLATLGQLLTLGVTFTVVCNLVLLPALIQLRRWPQSVESSPPRAA